MVREVFVVIWCITLIFVSCRKDSPVVDPPIPNPPDMLTGDTAILVGSWKWLYTEHTFNWCYGPTLYEVLDSVSESTQYSIEIFQNGLAKTYSNSAEMASYGIYFVIFGDPYVCYYLSGAERFSIDFDENPNVELDGCVNDDTMMVFRGFPFFNYDDPCESYHSYFIRQ